MPRRFLAAAAVTQSLLRHSSHGFGCRPQAALARLCLHGPSPVSLISTSLGVSSSDDTDGKSVVSSNIVGQESSTSPWASALWVLRLNFGKSSTAEEGVFPFFFNDNSSYGSSGSRLVVTCPVLVTAEDVQGTDRNDHVVVGRGSSVIRPLYSLPNSDKSEEDISKHYSYITLKGQQKMRLSQGGWVLEFPPSTGSTPQTNKNKGVASKLRFWMDLESDIERNDIQLAAGSRLYFAANCWREQDFDTGLARLRPIQKDAEAAVRAIQDQLSHESGDRRLDGVDAVETIQAYGDMAKLVLEKEQKMAKLQDALRKFPSSADDVEFLPDGPWPGSDEWLTLSDEKFNPIFILKDGGLLRGHEYEMVGTWTAEALIEGD